MPFFTALRQTRRLTGAWLLGVLLALLPLRGWAEVLMHTGGHAASESQVVDTDDWMPPCHAVTGEAGAEASGEAPDENASAVEPGQACSLCALCHASALRASETVVAPSPAVTAVPCAAVAGHGPPALPLPDRPPRA